MATQIFASEPGIRVDRRDLGVSSPQSAPTTDTMLIIGTAIDGPNDRPVWYTSIDDLIREFGPTDRRPELGHGALVEGFNGNTISRAAQEAWDGGCRSIIVRRVGGSKASTPLAGYNYATDTTAVITSVTGTANLAYGGFPLSNVVISNTLCTVLATSGADLRYATTVSLATDSYLDWTVYVPSRQWESRITANNGLTITLADSIPSYVQASDPFIIYPAGAYAIFDTNGNPMNPANFLIGPGSTTVACTITCRTSLVTDTRYTRHFPNPGETVIVHFYMLPDKVINLKSLTPSNIYNASGTYGTATQDGCWALLSQSLPTIGTLELFIPKFRSSPLTGASIPLPAVKFQLDRVGSYEEFVNKINTSPYNTSVYAEIASDATWNGTAVTINPLSGGSARGLSHVPGGQVAMFSPVTIGNVASRFSGGSSGVDMSPLALYNTLNGSGNGDGVLDELLDNVPAAYRYIAGAYADDTVNGVEGAWPTLLAKHCWTAARLGNACQGVIGVRPLAANDVTPDAVAARVTTLTDPTSGLGGILFGGITATDELTGRETDVGQYINITAGPDGYTRDPNLGRIYSNQSALYCGLLCNMDLNRSTTAFTLRGTTGLAYTYTRAQLNALIQGVGIDDLARGGAYTPFKLDALRRAITVHSGETAAKRNSQFTKEGVVKVVQVAESAVASAARAYIGKPNNIYTHQALQHACEMALEPLVELNALVGGKDVGYSIKISTTQEDRDIGRVKVEILLQTSVEIRMIYIPVTVQF